MGELTTAQLEAAAAHARYGGNPEHKWNPGDYGLMPPCNPRPGKTLCDAERSILIVEATDLLKAGFRRGMVSVSRRGNWHQNVWALSESGEVFEAQLENAEQGVYHGYPMSEDDDFNALVEDEWRRR